MSIRFSVKSSRYPRDLSQLLSSALKETFVKIGNKPIYKSDSKTVIARWSKKHNKKVRALSYWYGLKVPDLDRINEYCITHFAYVCNREGVILLPTRIIRERIRKDELLKSPKEGPLQHYHIQFNEEGGSMLWILKMGVRENVEKYYYKFIKTI